MAWVQKERRKDGTVLYRACWRTKTADGRWVKEYEPYSTAEDAEEKCRQVESARYRGVTFDHEGSKERLDSYAERWLVTRIQPKSGLPLRPKTLEGYRKLLKLYINPALGSMELRQITTPVVREWYVRARERSDLQARKAYRLLHAILVTANQDNRIGQVPHIPGAGQEHQEERALPADDVVVSLAEDIHPRLRAAVLLIAYCSLRPPSEIRGLRRSDVEIETKKIVVRTSVTDVVGEGTVVDAPKTDAGRRSIDAPAFVINALVDHMERFTGPEADDWLFTNPNGGQLRNAFFYEGFAASRKRLGLPSTFQPYDLRHFAATRTAEVPGMTLKTLMARIGHSSHTAALRYQHRSERLDRSAADHFEKLYADSVARKRGEEGKIIRLRRPS